MPEQDREQVGEGSAAEADREQSREPIEKRSAAEAALEEPRKLIGEGSAADADLAQPTSGERSRSEAGSGLSSRPDARAVSESFGEDPEWYDRARPRYPTELIERIVAGQAGPSVLDVGCGTGIAARQLRAAGCAVTGVEPDARMAAFAAEHGLAVEVAKFEDWDAAGRRFDILTAGMTWHWVDPVAGAEQAARVLRPGGRIALFWNAFQVPPELAEAFAGVYAKLLPEMPMYQHGVRAGRDVYAPLLVSTADRLRETGFERVEQWRDEWQRPYTRAEWLDLFPTFGGHALLPRETVAALQEAIGAEVDAVGGEFMVEYATVTVAAVRGDSGDN